MARKAKTKETYDSIKQCSLVKGIPEEHLTAARHLGAEGFVNHRIHWDKFGPWYEKNKAVVEQYLAETQQIDGDDDRGKLLREKARKEKYLADIAEIEALERKRKTLNKEEVIAFIKSIANSQSILLRNQSQELPHKLLGKNITEMGVILNNSFQDICSKIQQGIEKWNS